MTQTLPTLSAEISPKIPCTFGDCTDPAVVHAVIDYPTFQWTGDRCKPCLSAERALAVIGHATVTTTPVVTA